MTQGTVRGGVDNLDLRHAFGRFATGVTVVTTRTADGVPHGATVNAFTAVSLDPPLAQVTLTRTSRAARYLEGTPFAINILSLEQMDVALHFGGKVLDDEPEWALAGNVPHVLVAHPTLPAKTVREVIALGKAHPGELIFASQGQGTLSHMEQEMLKQMGGFTALHVPYKGSAPGLSDLLPGNVQLFFDSIPSSLPHIKSGRIRAIGVASSKRSPALPEVPALNESLKGFEADSWFGLMMPAGTPREIIMKMNGEVMKILAMQEVKDRLLSQGGVAAPGTPEQLAERIRVDIAKWGKVARTAGVKIE